MPRGSHARQTVADAIKVAVGRLALASRAIAAVVGRRSP